MHRSRSLDNLPALLAAFESELTKAPEKIRVLCESRMSDARSYIQDNNCRGARAYLEGLEDELKFAKAPAGLQRTFGELFDTVWFFG